MKKILNRVSGIAVVLLAAVLLAACSPQDEGDQATTTAEVPVTETQMATDPAATETDMTDTPEQDGTPSAAEPMAVLASDLIGAPIEDLSAAALGEVQDLLMTHDGNIQFLVLDYDDPDSGESRIVAVPWVQVEVQADSAVTQDFAPVVIVEAGQLAAAQEVDLDLLDINAIDDDMDANENENENEAGDNDNENDNRNDNTSGLAGEFEGLIRVGQFTDFNLRNEAGEDLGEVEDLAIDLESAQIAYAIADIGGFLGLGEQTVAIPWSQFSLDRSDDEVTFVAPVDAEVLENAPEVDLTTWPEYAAAEWDAEVAGYWDTLVD